MLQTKKEIHPPNKGARRHDVVISHSHRSKKHKKDTDAESVSSTADTIVSPPPPKPSCPLRPVMKAMFEPEEGTENEKKRECPLKRVSLWHILPMCLFLVVNIFLAIIFLLGLALWRISIEVEHGSMKLWRARIKALEEAVKLEAAHADSAKATGT